MPRECADDLMASLEGTRAGFGVAVTTTEATPARICMPTSRHIRRRAYQCGLYEAQDVLRAIDDVDLICLEPNRGFQFKERWQRRLLFRDVSRKLVFLNPGLRTVTLTREYDLFVAVCQNYLDLLYINAIDGWKDHCKTSVCWLDEAWLADIPRGKCWKHALSQFDHVFVGCSGTVASLSAAIGRVCRWIPAGVDTIRFSPYPNPSPRVIDVYSIGRRRECIHRALLDAAARREIFYTYDTFPAMANLEPYDHQQHRDLYANVAKRSRFFMVAPGKMDLFDETRGQVEIGYRYYEGAAAGVVMIGQPPDCQPFRETFNWPDAVVRIEPDGSDVLDVLADLRSKAGRLETISQRNAAEALLRHDWVYRWKEILRVAGIEPSARLTERERRLRELASLAINGNHHDRKMSITSRRAGRLE